jgi:uncharacterized protein YndB with AHSA1/START domain
MSMAQEPSANTDRLVRKNVFVAVPEERAFDFFTKDFASWWPLESHHIGKVDAKTAVMELRAGGRWYEKGVDGSECEWGYVKDFDRPRRLVIVWQLSHDFKLDKTIYTEVEVTFTPENGGTRVELEHRMLDAYGTHAAEMRKTFDSDGGWNGLLQGFAKKLMAS